MTNSNAGRCSCCNNIPGLNCNSGRNCSEKGRDRKYQLREVGVLSQFVIDSGY